MQLYDFFKYKFLASRSRSHSHHSNCSAAKVKSAVKSNVAVKSSKQNLAHSKTGSAKKAKK